MQQTKHANGHKSTAQRPRTWNMQVKTRLDWLLLSYDISFMTILLTVIFMPLLTYLHKPSYTLMRIMYFYDILYSHT
jgi:hypothetical protein